MMRNKIFVFLLCSFLFFDSFCIGKRGSNGAGEWETNSRSFSGIHDSISLGPGSPNSDSGNQLRTNVMLHGSFDLLKVSQLYASFRKIYRTWDSMSSVQKIEYFDNRFKEDKYIGYFFSECAKFYFYTQNPKIKRLFNESVDFVRRNYNENGRLLTKGEVKDGQWYREVFARNTRLLFDSWVYTHSKKVLNVIDSQVAAWISNNEPKKNKNFQIFAYSRLSSNNEINPNQNLQLALAFSDVYFEPQSRFYHDAQLKRLAFNEVNAALSIMKEDGFLPLSESHLKVGDSNYAGLSSTVLYKLCQMWGEEEWINKLKKIGRWLNSAFDENRPWNTNKDGDDYHFDRLEPYNLYSRIPAFYAAGISSDRAKEWMKFVKVKFPGFEILGLVPRWGFLQSLPESYYSEETRTKRLKVLPASVYAYIMKDTLRFNVVASEVSSISINSNRYEVDDQEVKIVKRKGDVTKINVSDVFEQHTMIKFSLERNINVIKLIVFDINNPLKNK